MRQNPPTILVVDDDIDIAANLTDILREQGYRTSQAHSGGDAIRLISKGRFDIALLDYKMPDIDGITLYRQLKERQPDVTAIMITAFAGADGVQRAKAAGTWRVLSKPVDIDDLLQHISEAVA